jgi:hypothetical protein
MQEEFEINEIVASLPELWGSYQKADVKQSHPFKQVMQWIGVFLNLPTDGDYWNDAIDWLDENYPLWRGYPVQCVRGGK